MTSLCSKLGVLSLVVISGLAGCGEPPATGDPGGRAGDPPSGIELRTSALTAGSATDGNATFIASGGNGRIVVTWLDYWDQGVNRAGTVPHVWAQAFDAVTMASVAGPTQLSWASSNSLYEPRIIAAGSNRLFITYDLIYSFFDYDVRGVIVDANLNVVAPDFSIEGWSLDDVNPRATFDPGTGKILVMYDEFALDANSNLQRQAPMANYIGLDGTVGPRFRFNLFSPTGIALNDLTMAHGKLVVVWSSGIDMWFSYGTFGTMALDVEIVTNRNVSAGHGVVYNPYTDVVAMTQIGGLNDYVQTYPYTACDVGGGLCAMPIARIWTGTISAANQMEMGLGLDKQLTAIYPDNQPSAISFFATNATATSVASRNINLPAGCVHTDIYGVAGNGGANAWVVWQCSRKIWAQEVTSNATLIGSPIALTH
jgi:hypothetical protein